METANDSPQQSPPSRFTIVVGLDFTDADAPAFDQAARLARRVPRSALHLVHVFPGEPSAARAQDLVSHLRLYVNEKAAMPGGLGGVSVGIHLRSGKPVREIVQLATEVSADLIVVGLHGGTHLRHLIVGSTEERLVRGAPCPVIVASPRAREPETHVPAIEPPCPDCVRTRAASGGAQWWCERHSHRANGAHTFSYERELPLASHDAAITPTGIDF